VTPSGSSTTPAAGRCCDLFRLVPWPSARMDWERRRIHRTRLRAISVSRAFIGTRQLCPPGGGSGPTGSPRHWPPGRVRGRAKRLRLATSRPVVISFKVTQQTMARACPRPHQPVIGMRLFRNEKRPVHSVRGVFVDDLTTNESRRRSDVRHGESWPRPVHGPCCPAIRIAASFVSDARQSRAGRGNGFTSGG